MATITEDYVSDETFKLLKEKGFDDSCCRFVVESDETYHRGAPTLQMTMKWLREEKGIAVVPILSSILDNERFLWDIEITVAKTNETYHQGWTYESYERACEVAIKYCLENLI